MGYRVERWYITKEIPALGVIVNILMIICFCVVVYEFIKYKWNNSKLKEKLTDLKNNNPKMLSMLICSIILLTVFLIIGISALYSKVIVPGPLKHAEELAAEGKYDEAIEAYKKLDYENESERDNILGDLYAKKVESLLEQSAITEVAEVMYENLYRYKSFRLQAVDFLKNNNELFQLIFSPGSKIPFGSDLSGYESERKAQWYILEKKDDCVLLIAEKSTSDEKMGEHDSNNPENITKGWEDSLIRAHLNDGKDSLYQSMFSNAERAAIKLTTLENTIHVDNEAVEGNNTQDYLFVLSFDEVLRYYELVSSDFVDPDWWRLHGVWWTRTAATLEKCLNEFGGVRIDHFSNHYMLSVSCSGNTIGYTLTEVNKREYVYPAMWVNINDLLQAWLQ